MKVAFVGFRGDGRSALRALAAAVFLVYLFALPPHLVHHLFDEDQGHLTCPYLAHSQHSPGIQTDPFTLSPPGSAEAHQGLPSPVLLCSDDLTAGNPRAPPRVPPFV
ncbi:MAG: hypothetical protein HYS14_02765 [Candidatus Rokubacteria bacterium]|nr:hypothetical protein [Candidatus Rokubacteria bacterium]